MATAGWSKPLKVRYQMNLPELMSSIRRYTPVGSHSHDRISGQYRAAGFPRTGGRLRRAVSTLANYRAPRGKNTVTLSNLPVYAAMIEAGGAVKPVSGKLMGWSGGIARKRRGYVIKGKRYMRRGYRDWVGGGRGITPRWQ